MKHEGKQDWQQRLHQSIPLARAMQVSCRQEADGRICLLAPLAPNCNDKGTAFGGSLATLATLAGWVEVQRQLELALPDERAEIVIQHGASNYLLPAGADFSACALPLAADAIERFIRQYRRRGLARLALQVDLHCAGQRVAQFGGDYVARRLPD